MSVSILGTTAKKLGLSMRSEQKSWSLLMMA